MPDSKNMSSVDRPDVNVHKQKRAMLTRQELLQSARAVFASDGFEHARIEDIASRAGKTRGAFYTNFKGKEDVFCAIFEENISRDLSELTPLLLGLPNVEQRIEALGDYLSELSKDRERTLLNLEFKLYAIRHPRKRKRLADLHGIMRLRTCIPGFTQILSHVSGLQSTSEQLINTLAFGGIMEGLTLNYLFDPEASGSFEIARYLKACLCEMLQVVPQAV